MKKSNLIIKSLMVMGALFMTSCNTDDGISCPDPLVGELTAKETEFAGKWIFTAMEADKAIDITDDKTDNPNTDLFAQHTACDRDLVYDFLSNRDYSYKQGSVAADCTNKQSLTGTWSLADSKLSFVANCSSQTMPIVISETGDSFSYDATLNITDANGDAKTAKVTFTYTKEPTTVTPQ